MRKLFILSILLVVTKSVFGQDGNFRKLLGDFEDYANIITDLRADESSIDISRDELALLFTSDNVHVFDFYAYYLQNSNRHSIPNSNLLNDYNKLIKLFIVQLSYDYKGYEFKIDDSEEKIIKTSIDDQDLNKFKVSTIIEISKINLNGNQITINNEKSRFSINFFVICPEGKIGNCLISKIVLNDDVDKDGFVGDEDKCPFKYGRIKGCPDSDNDGVADLSDECPYTPAHYPKMAYGCPDSDSDGIADKDDKCPFKAGIKSNDEDCKGCPDSDRDGICDKKDKCPFISGVEGNDEDCKGCPDSDDDGICDAKDKCPYEAGGKDCKGCLFENGVCEVLMNEEFERIKGSKNVDTLQSFQDKYPYSPFFLMIDNIIRKVKKMPIRKGNSSMRMVRGGIYDMGCPRGVLDCKCICKRDNPRHKVRLNPFHIDLNEVTNQQYVDFLNVYMIDSVNKKYPVELMIKDGMSKIRKNGKTWEVDKYKNNASLPVVGVTWFGAREYARYYGLDLPTEAEWEYAASGGANKDSKFFSGSDSLELVAWYKGNSMEHVHSIDANLMPNSLGIYNMTGNVFEWCSDDYDTNFYYEKSEGIQDEPTGGIGNTKVIRGGAWDTPKEYCYIFHRSSKNPREGMNNIGFRCVKRH